MVRHPSFHVLYGRFSPDNRRVSFIVRRPNNRSWIAVAPLDGSPKPIAEEAWIKISEEGPEDRANRSSDGKTLYFTSRRDGWLCLWGSGLMGRRADPRERLLPHTIFISARFFNNLAGHSKVGE